MPSPRLQQQFIHLWQSCQGQPQQTTLQDLAQALSCSRRHTRSLLKAMQEKGWLEWRAAAGRGKRSQLKFHYAGPALQQQRAEELLEQGRIDRLVQLVGDPNELRQMLLAHLGASVRQGRHILRLPYSRPLINLLPGEPLRGVESHLVRQIFSGLTRLNEENGELEPDLAHRWQAISPYHWRFYLRPAIPFHHGRRLTLEDVSSSLLRLGSHRLFSHIHRIASPAANVLDIHLTDPDEWLPWLLGSVPALILPAEWRTLRDFARHPVGTGPFRVVENNPTLLKLGAFDAYFGFRALMDEINIWILPTFSGEWLGDEPRQREARLEEGCYYLLYDGRALPMQNPDQRRWLSEAMEPILALAHTDPAFRHRWTPAYGLLPRWRHAPVPAPMPKPDGLERITLTHYWPHPEFDAICHALTQALAERGVELVVNRVDYATWRNGEGASDIWLGSAAFCRPLEYQLFARLYAMPLLSHCLGRELTDELALWRSRRLPPAKWGRELVKDYRLHPLFHRSAPTPAEPGTPITVLDGVDFKSIWFTPPQV